MAKAQKVKGEYSFVLTGANEIVTAVEGGAGEWKWANNDENVGELKKRVAAVKANIDHKGYRKFILKTAQELKRENADAAALLGEAQALCDSVPPLVSHMQKRVKGLLSMQQARLSCE